MIYDTFPVNYSGRRTEFMTNPDPSWGDLYINFMKSGFSSTELGLYQSFREKGKYDKTSVFFDEEAYAQTDVLDKESFKTSPFFDEQISFYDGMTKAELQLIRERLDRERELALMMSNADSLREWSAIGLGLLSGSLPSVMNFMPIVRGFKGLDAALTFARLGKYGNRFVKGAVDAGIATSIINVPYAMDRNNYQLDYDLNDYMMDVGIGSMLGGGIGTVLGGMYDGKVARRADLDVFDETQPLFSFKNSADQPSLMETRAGTAIQKVDPASRYVATRTAAAQIANEEPVDVSRNMPVSATAEEINEMVNDVIPNQSAVTEPPIGTAERGRRTKDANNISDPNGEIEIFDGAETNLVLLATEDGVKGAQIKLIPLTEESFKKYFGKDRILFQKKLAYAQRVGNESNKKINNLDGVEESVFTYDDGSTLSIASIKNSDLSDADGSLAKYLEFEEEYYGTNTYQPTHIQLIKKDGQKDFKFSGIGSKPVLRDYYNSNGVRGKRLQVNNFQNKLGQQWRNTKANDSNAINEFAKTLKNYRSPVQIDDPPIDHRVVPDPQSEPLPNTDLNNTQYQKTLTERELEADTDFYASNPTDEEIKFYENEKMMFENAEKDIDSLIPDVAACVRKNG